MLSPSEKIRDTALQVMELKSLIGVLTSDANFSSQDKAATKLENLIPDLAVKFKALDISIAQQAILRERIQSEIGILLEKRLYYVVRANMLQHCLSINPNPIRLQDQIMAGLSCLISGGTEKPFIYNAIECVDAGGIVDSDSGFSQMIGRLQKASEGHVSYRATNKKELARASMATRICSGLIQNMIGSGYLLNERNHGAVVTDALCLMSAMGGKEGAHEALKWLVQLPEMFKLERELYNYPKPDSSASEDRVVDLAAEVIKKTTSTNILSALFELDVERYHKACDSPDVRYTAHRSIVGDVESFDIESFRGASFSLLEVISEAVRRRFSQDQPLSEKRGKVLLRALQVNGYSVGDFVESLGTFSILNQLQALTKEVVPEPFHTQDDAEDYMCNTPLARNAVLLAMLTKQKELIQTLKAGQADMKLVSALMLYHHDVDLYDMLDITRDHLTHLEFVAYAVQESEDFAPRLKETLISTWHDTRTVESIRNFDPTTFNVMAGLMPSVFTDDFARQCNSKNLHMRKKLFTLDLCI